MTKYNLDKLIKVECNDFRPSAWYTFKNEKKFFGVVTQKRGIYYEWINDSYLGFEVPENHILKDFIIYEKPEVILYYQDDYSEIYYFNTYDEAKEFSDKITIVGRWRLGNE